MTHLSLTFLGTFKVTAGELTLRSFRTDKMRALLAYLALTPPYSHSREQLAALLWPERDHKSALYNLRLTLHRLNQTLDEATPGTAARVLTLTRTNVEFHPLAVQSDVAHFRKLLIASESHSHISLARCELCLAQLQQAVDLYQGELLAGLGASDTPAFEEWLLLQREVLHQQLLSTLHTLSAAYEARGDEKKALAYAQQKLSQDPYLEESHVQVMQLLIRLGHREQALVQYERCRRYLYEAFGVEPRAETQALAERLRSRDGLQAPPIHQAQQLLSTRMRHNLPAQTTTFWGRKRELKELIAYLQKPTRRLLTLVGPGGMGKTRLALEIAHRMLPKFDDGIFFVSLAALTDPTLVAAAITTALNLTLSGDLPQALYQALHSKRLLLILDNCEQLLPASLVTREMPLPPNQLSSFVQLVTELLQQAPNLCILATSRERLNLRAEWLYPIEGIDFAPATIATASESAAVRLFEESAQRLQPNFRIDETNLSAILQICQLVEGMPLGLELAAAWVEQLSPAEIAQQLAQNGAMLAVKWNDLPDRQRSMQATFAWSWQLLSRDEQQLLQQLAIFQGDFTDLAVKSITGASLHALTRLQQKSLVRSRAISPVAAKLPRVEQSRRYYLHELVRQFAEESLKTRPDEYDRIALRHATYYLQFVAERELPLARAQARQATLEIQAEISNIRQAWLWAATYQQFTLLNQSVYGLWQFYILNGLTAEATQLFQVAIQALQAVLPNGCPVDERQLLFGKLLSMQAYLFNRQNRNDEGWRHATQAAQFYQAQLAHLPADSPYWHAGQEVGILIGCIHGLLIALRLELEPARQEFEQVLINVASLQQRGPVSELVLDAEWMSHLYLGVIARTQDDSNTARERVQWAATRCQQLGKLRGQLNCLSNLGAIEMLAGNYQAARQSYEQVLYLTQNLGYRWIEAVQLVELGCTLRELGEYSLALEKLENGWMLLQEMDKENIDLFAISELTRLESFLGRFERARHWLTYYNAANELGTNFYTYEEKWLAEAVLALQQADYPAAITAATAAWELVRETGSRLLKAHSQTLLGHAQVHLGQWAEARAAYQVALQHYQALDRLALVIEAQAGLATVALAEADHEQALSLVEEILPVMAKHAQFGLYEPFQVQLSCYHVLAAHHDVRAHQILRQAQNQLQKYAQRIVEPTLRHSFLENVPLHLTIQTLAHSLPARTP